MKTSDFYYDLPQHLIAQTPLKKRDSSRLMAIDRNTGAIEHRYFTDLVDYLEAGDCLVLNDSRVLPARLLGQRADTGAPVELVLLTDKGNDLWECMTRPGRKCKLGHEFMFGDGLLRAKVEGVEQEAGNRYIRFLYQGVFLEILEKLGTMPLPPYIKEKLDDPERYQTVYSKELGSAAAPTAGLHFTEQLLQKIKDKGVKIATLTLHVGLGTFRPVKVNDLSQHVMHSEYYSLDKKNADIINQTRLSAHRIFAVGTTVCRTLETIADLDGFVQAQNGWTNIFIYPGYQFKIIDCLITNFHLPESTLMMLISAFAGRDKIIQAYQVAIESEYRFFSFGDAMLLYDDKKIKE